MALERNVFCWGLDFDVGFRSALLVAYVPQCFNSFFGPFISWIDLALCWNVPVGVLTCILGFASHARAHMGLTNVWFIWYFESYLSYLLGFPTTMLSYYYDIIHDITILFIIALAWNYVTKLLYYHAIILPWYCNTILLHRYIPIIRFYQNATLRSHWNMILLYSYNTIWSYHCFTIFL